MEAKHTPGPWWLDDENCVGAGNQIIAIVRLPLDSSRRGVEEQWNANASLIAAAPNLLEVLQEAADRIEGLKGGSVSETVVLMRAAIAAATTHD